MNISHIALLIVGLVLIDSASGAQQIVQCHSGGTGTIAECQQRDAQARSNRTVQCHSGGTGTIAECQQRDAQARSNRTVQCHSGGTGTIEECKQRDAQARANKTVQCHSGGTGTIEECKRRDAQSGLNKPLGRYPLEGSISQGFGVPWSRNPSKTHTGVDIPAARGIPVPSMGNGRVAHVHNLGIDGMAVIVQEDSGAIRGYLHLTDTVSSGQQVQRGQTLGKVLANHLHYNVCRSVNLCWRGALPTSSIDPAYPNDPLFRDGPFISP